MMGVETRRMGAELLSRYMGCLLGGAIGDALGAPVEFMGWDAIAAKYGEKGVADFDVVYGRRGAITDDTQMTLFTVEGLIRAECRGSHRGICSIEDVVQHAYKRWLATQDGKPGACKADYMDGWLIRETELFSRRAPGNSCLSALRSGQLGRVREPINNSKGCGGVMRVAPVGLYADDPESAFQLGCDVAALTHGHPSGYLAAGMLAAIIWFVLQERPLIRAIGDALYILRTHDGHEEVYQAVEHAVGLAKGEQPLLTHVEKLGAGWVAEEALAISLYCALCAGDDFAKGVLAAVNHGGDSDSTGAITGNILGTIYGRSVIPEKWQDALELHDVIERLAMDLFLRFENSDRWWSLYPGW